MTGPYTLVGARLVERGYAAIPIIPGTKRPGYLLGSVATGINDWREKYTKRLPTMYEIQFWSKTDSGVCVVTGPGSQGTVAVDIDTDNPEIKGAIEGAIPRSTVRKRGAKAKRSFTAARTLQGRHRGT
jgi:hypothetical protein